MPELPEVEIVTRHLRAFVAGRTIAHARLLRERLSPSPPEEFSRALAGGSIRLIHRRGKNILVDLDNGVTLLTHLRMSGRFMLLGEDEVEPRFTHAVFHLDDASKLIFHDQRHFGLMKVIPTHDLFRDRALSSLAPEPFSDNFSAAYLHSTLKRSSRDIKSVLLDQTRVCGVGNIYASEALFLAAIHPAMRSNRITRPRAARLHAAILSVLSATIEIGETITPDASDIGGNIYGNASDAEWHVYGREGHACPVCASVIKRIKQAGRSTFFCPKCQRR
jgi:formamidopyrimidine-DNA glycosylase